MLVNNKHLLFNRRGMNIKKLPNTLTYNLHTSKEQWAPRRWPKTETERCRRNK